MRDRKLLLITGAGASVNLSMHPDEPLPLMGDWARRLCEHLGPGLAEITGLQSAADGMQFEETLGAIFRWLNALPDGKRFSRMARQEPNHNDNLPDQFAGIIANVERNAAVFQTRLHESLFDEFGPERIDADKTAAAYGALFERLGLTDRGRFEMPFICATTNYDRSLEIALEQLGANPRTGFTPQSFRTPALDATALGTFEDRPAVLYLHGAVGWYELEAGTVTSEAADRGYNASLGTPAVLYPSPDKEVERTSTRELWTAFKDALAAATHVFVLGHSLNDDHLVREIATCNARVAVTYLAAGPMASERAANVASEHEATIKRKLPSATPVAIDFGPDLSVASNDLAAWELL